MFSQIDEFKANQVSGLNKSIIKSSNEQPDHRENHYLVRESDLESCIGSIFSIRTIFLTTIRTGGLRYLRKIISYLPL